jgi:hypothetical protein
MLPHDQPGEEHRDSLDAPNASDQHCWTGGRCRNRLRHPRRRPHRRRRHNRRSCRDPRGAGRLTRHPCTSTDRWLAPNWPRAVAPWGPRKTTRIAVSAHADRSAWCAPNDGVARGGRWRDAADEPCLPPGSASRRQRGFGLAWSFGVVIPVKSSGGWRGGCWGC